MAIKDILDEIWETNKKVDAVMEFRATFENAFNVIVETIDNLDRIVAESDFSGVDPELLAEGQTCRQALDAAQLILNDHTEFINWRQPE